MFNIGSLVRVKTQVTYAYHGSYFIVMGPSDIHPDDYVDVRRIGDLRVFTLNRRSLEKVA